MYERKVFERYLKRDDEKRLFKTVAQFNEIYARRDYAWMRLLRQTGIRVTPLSLLTVGDARLALVEKRLQIRPETNKRLKGYAVPLNKKAGKALRDLLRIQKEMVPLQLPDQRLIMGRNHKGISVRSLQERMCKWALAAGLGDGVTPHWFRHTLAKRIMETSTAKDPRVIVQHALGQASINSSAVYTFPDREDFDQAMEAAS